ncbi:MAG: hypothetical protein COW04_12900 [Deltaproteobacteria bacterium CG12_big_fil_rev_8_21_14_0_65_43_10]|nr:MAG: hypothetical protein COW04_12900 [Deltaproteobacteria bacterium CG12_big_fil_rev_8_21_14_0_65_43_10]PIU86408.1 MAG: hypothetical protein COS67_02605 [Deltaproteobacteria bacterium CG06_land_8_20_14_3_00_44_19]PIX25599.1 MAG: hypothetical protein COZ68_03630 [Deltaproteobacteria bacterium CG_4_8_14_3_um_filter_43_13]PIZ20028.1 MAG: hypothetical protein COY50_06920 [Deltaproteobacteria bacterium CG_4_10_14_0_8_um_filter_43_12]PJB46557.1 MAG: hypothetical protein CO106_00105 [Deltaproteoba
MWSEALRIGVIGFSVVFITLLILTLSVKVMSFVCKRIEKKRSK